jgi:small subunit ribosomal protein S4
MAKNFAEQAKRLTVQESPQSKKEGEQMLARLCRLGLLPQGAGIDDVLGIAINDVLERRLQTIVFKKGFARSIKQARQFITHQHIAVNNKLITTPSYLVPISEEERVSFVQKSTLSNPEHPERIVEKAKPKEGKKKVVEEKEKPKSAEQPKKETQQKQKAKKKEKPKQKTPKPAKKTTRKRKNTESKVKKESKE